MEPDPSRRRTPRRHSSPRKDQELADQQHSTTYTRLHGRKQSPKIRTVSTRSSSRVQQQARMQELVGGVEDIDHLEGGGSGKERIRPDIIKAFTIQDLNPAAGESEMHEPDQQGATGLVTAHEGDGVPGSGHLGSYADYGLHGIKLTGTNTNNNNNDNDQIRVINGRISLNNRSTTTYTPSLMSVHTSTEGLDQELLYGQSEPSMSYPTNAEAGSAIRTAPANQEPELPDNNYKQVLPADNHDYNGQYHPIAEKRQQRQLIKSSGADHIELRPEEDHHDNARHRHRRPFVISSSHDIRRDIHHEDKEEDDHDHEHLHQSRRGASWRSSRSLAAMSCGRGLTRRLKRSGSAIVSHVNDRVVKKLKVVPGRIAARPRHVAFVVVSSTLVTAVGLASYWYHLKKLKLEREKAQSKRWWWW